MKEQLELRMYGFVPYQLTGIQKGIQFGHAVVEYGLSNFNDNDYIQWARNFKTFIILNGGTTSNNPLSLGTINNFKLLFELNGIKIKDFHEPDLGDQLTSFVFIVDERVFNKVKYPDLDPVFINHPGYYHFNEEWKSKFNDTKENIDKIIFLRNFLLGKDLA